MIDRNHGWNKSFKPLFLGLVSSLLLIAGIYRLHTRHHLKGLPLQLTVLGLGSLLALVQLIFFLHLGLESKPRWNSITFLFTVLVIAIVIGGALWIMQNLNYNVMPTMEH